MNINKSLQQNVNDLRNVEREQLRILSRAIMQGRTDERSMSRIHINMSYAMQGGGRDDLNRLRDYVTDDHRY